MPLLFFGEFLDDKMTLRAQINRLRTAMYLAWEHRSEQLAVHPGSHYSDLLVLIIWG